MGRRALWDDPDWWAINLSVYSKYQRQDFIAMLNDWGWFGFEDKRPEWYSGECWS